MGEISIVINANVLIQNIYLRLRLKFIMHFIIPRLSYSVSTNR